MVTVKDQAEGKPKEGPRRRPMIIALAGVLLMVVGAVAVRQFGFPPTHRRLD